MKRKWHSLSLKQKDEHYESSEKPSLKVFSSEMIAMQEGTENGVKCNFVAVCLICANRMWKEK